MKNSLQHGLAQYVHKNAQKNLCASDSLLLSLDCPLSWKQRVWTADHLKEVYIYATNMLHFRYLPYRLINKWFFEIIKGFQEELSKIGLFDRKIAEFCISCAFNSSSNLATRLIQSSLNGTGSVSLKFMFAWNSWTSKNEQNKRVQK